MRRFLKAAGLIVIGAILATAGFAAGWYQWYRKPPSPSGPISITQVQHFDDSQKGLHVARCEVNRNGDEALAYGSFNKNATHGNEVTLNVFGQQQQLLGSTTNKSVDVTPGTPWTVAVHLLQGFGAPKFCLLGAVFFVILRGDGATQSFRATSGPVILLRSGNVEAMTASDAASPPNTVAQYAIPGIRKAMPTCE